MRKPQHMSCIIPYFSRAFPSPSSSTYHEVRSRKTATRPSSASCSPTRPSYPSSVRHAKSPPRCTYGPSSCGLESRCDVLGSSFPRSLKVTFDSFFDTRLTLRARAAFTLKTALAVLSELAMAFSFRCVNRWSCIFTTLSSGLSRNIASPTCVDGHDRSRGQWRAAKC